MRGVGGKEKGMTHWRVLEVEYSGTCVNGHLRRAVTLHKAVSTESPNGIFHALHTH